MTLTRFLSDLRQRRVQLWVEAGKLRFSAPKGVLTPELYRQLSERKSDILEFLHKAEVAYRPQLPLSPAPRNAPLPLSFAQQRLWFLQQLHPHSSAYHIPLTLRLTGTIDQQALILAFNEIIRRHEILRTTFHNEAGRAVQVVHQAQPVNVPVVDLGPMPAAAQELKIKELMRELVDAPFDLTRWPLLRARLVRLNDQAHVFTLVLHHIISDGWSTGVLIRELAVLYEAYARQQAAPLSALPLQYADYAYWQRAWLQGQGLERDLTYWQTQLAGAPAQLDLPADHSRGAVPHAPAGYATSRFSHSLSAELNALSQRQGGTLFMTLLAAFYTLLYRYTGQDDIVVGTPVAGRLRVETENLIGFFVNTLALRARLSGTMSFVDLLHQVREVALGAYAHQELPFEKVVEVLQPERSLSLHPLFQVMFVMQNTPLPFKQGGIDLTLLEMENTTAKFDLTLRAMEEPAGLAWQIEYNRALFEPATVERLLGHLGVLLEAAVADPGRPLAELPLLTEAERAWLSAAGRGPATALPAACIHELFSAQAALTPAAWALVQGAQHVTYGELEARANRLAHVLQAHGVGPDTRVGLCLPRRPDLIVALLGILKAGAAYVPLDPGYPAARLAFMIEDADIVLLLTEQALRKVLPTQQDVPVLCLDIPETWSSAENTAAYSTNRSSPEDVAYIMYTSGSSGRPKGVVVPHRGVVRLVNDAQYANFGPDEVFLQAAPVSFDASTFEIWGALLNGARLVLMPEQTPTLESLGEVIRHHKVTTLWLTAGLFHLMVEEHLDALGGLRQLLAGGDVLSVAHVEKVRARFPHCRLINGYGPTENTTFSCCFTVPSDYPLQGSVPIGRPIAHTQAYILDAHRQPVPVGVAGELYLGGAGLAHGYWKLPELTAEHFIFDVQECTSVAEDRSPRAIHPFDPADGARLYRTGDQVRYRSDGTIEFLGRRDQQVKVRGFRIELGEIETLLNAHPGVQECLVLARQDRPGEKQLVAYWIPRPSKKPGNAPSSAELRAYLANKLPDYMVPAAFVPLERLLLTPNGKPDRAALPAPFQDTALRVPVAAPHGPLEQVIAGLYAQVLGHEQIDREESFFALGGYSLLAMQVLARLREALGVSVPVRTLFEAPTVSALSAWLTATAPDPARLAARARLYNDVAQLSPEAVQVQLAQRRVGRGARGDSKLE